MGGLWPSRHADDSIWNGWDDAHVRRFAFVLAVTALAGAILTSCVALGQAEALPSGPPSPPAPLSLPEALAPASGSAVVIAGTVGADVITIHQDAGGSLTVTLNGRARVIGAADAARLVVDGGSGSDVITADASVTVPVTIFGGAGNDTVSCRGSGTVYVDGGPGNDAIAGGSGPGMLFGGAGNDQLVLHGAAGTMAGGPGADTYAGGDATSRVFAQRGETVASPGRVTFVPLGPKDASGHAPGYLVHVAGSAAFRQRVSSDITALLSVPAGRALLTALDDAGHAVSVAQSSAGNQTTVPDPTGAFLKLGGAHGAGSAATISYNPYETIVDSGTQPWQARPPIVGFYHELVHALNSTTGTMQPGKNAAGVPKLELQAIGLPFKGIVYRWGPTSVASPANPRVFTENGCRALLGIARRTAY
jgi:hypothetical protein